MTSANTVGGTTVARERTLRETLSAYARLSNLKVYFQWIPALVALSLVPDPLGIGADAWLALGLFVIGVVAAACAAGTLDDIQGARDGLDRATYADEEDQRSFSAKPLISGEISEQAAYRFALACGALGLGLGALAAVVAPHGPWWMVFAWPLAGWLATQYSWGIKLSYHGAAELLLGVEAIAIMLIPLVFLTGGVSDTGLFEALLLGTLFAQVTVFSSSHDAEIDRRFNRMTMAARLTPEGNRRFIATVFAAGWATTAAGFASGALEPWLALALIPVWAIQLAQLRQGLGLRRWLVARHLGWRAFDAGFVALVVVNLLTS